MILYLTNLFNNIKMCLMRFEWQVKIWSNDKLFLYSPYSSYSSKLWFWCFPSSAYSVSPWLWRQPLFIHSLLIELLWNGASSLVCQIKVDSLVLTLAQLSAMKGRISTQWWILLSSNLFYNQARNAMAWVALWLARSSWVAWVQQSKASAAMLWRKMLRAAQTAVALLALQLRFNPPSFWCWWPCLSGAIEEASWTCGRCSDNANIEQSAKVWEIWATRVPPMCYMCLASCCCWWWPVVAVIALNDVWIHSCSLATTEAENSPLALLTLQPMSLFLARICAHAQCYQWFGDCLRSLSG